MSVMLNEAKTSLEADTEADAEAKASKPRPKIKYQIMINNIIL